MIPDDVREAISICVMENTDMIEDYLHVLREWLENLIPEMPKPDWSRAPAWAQWWAVDGLHNGTGYVAGWFSEEPEHDDVMGMWTGNPEWGDTDDCFDQYIVLPIGIDWRCTLQRRPE